MEGEAFAVFGVEFGRGVEGGGGDHFGGITRGELERFESGHAEVEGDGGDVSFEQTERHQRTSLGLIHTHSAPRRAAPSGVRLSSF